MIRIYLLYLKKSVVLPGGRFIYHQVFPFFTLMDRDVNWNGYPLGL